MSSKILFSICGIGLGHSYRSYRLIRELERYGYDIYVVTSGDGLPFFKRYSYPLYPVRRLDFEWREFGLSVERTLALSFEGIYTQFRQFVDEYKLAKELGVDLIVSDSKAPPLFMAKIKNVPSVLITNQLAVVSNYDSIDKLISTSMPKVWGLSDLIIIPDMPPPYTITYKNNVYPLLIHSELRDKVTFVGQVLDFELYDSDITSYSDREYDVYILVSGPLYDKKLFSCRMVRLARNLSHKYRTIVSMGDPDLEVSVLRGNLNVFGWVADTMMFLEKTRLVVLRGGQTSIFESILRGTPMLVIPPRGQTEQLENAYRVRMLGIGEYIDPSDSDDLGFIVGVINDIFDNYSFYIRNILRIRKFLLDCGGLNKAVMEIKKLIV